VLRGLLAEQTYYCVAGAEETELAAASWTPQALPAGLPPIEVKVPNPTMGYFVFNISRAGPSEPTWVVLVDGLGQVRWQMDPGVHSMPLDVSWVGENLLVGGDQAVPTLYSLDFEPLWTVPAGREWTHDAGLNEAEDGLLGIVRTDYRLEDGSFSNGGFAIVEVPFAEGGSRWFWDANDYRDALQELADFDYPGDLFHPNSVYEEDGLIYVHLRRADCVLVIDRSTKELKYILRPGNVRLLGADGQELDKHGWFQQAHDAKVEGDIFTIYSNENPRKNFRVLTWTLDLPNGVATVVDEWSAPNEEDWSTLALGGADRDAEGYLSVAFGDHLNDLGSTLFRVDPSGEIICQLSYPSGYGIYRSEYRKTW
jgi:hypothetical protein